MTYPKPIFIILDLDHCLIRGDTVLIICTELLPTLNLPVTSKIITNFFTRLGPLSSIIRGFLIKMRVDALKYNFLKIEASIHSIVEKYFHSITYKTIRYSITKILEKVSELTSTANSLYVIVVTGTTKYIANGVCMALNSMFKDRKNSLRKYRVVLVIATHMISKRNKTYIIDVFKHKREYLHALLNVLRRYTQEPILVIDDDNILIRWLEILRDKFNVVTVHVKRYWP